MKNICAITGSNGYVGSGIKQYLAAQGWSILELSRQGKPGVASAFFQLGAPVAPAMLEGVSALVHCAYDFRPLRREEIHAVNVSGTEKLFQAARAAGVSKIIHISTISAYPGCRSLYGQAKLETEQIALACHAQVIRPGLVYSSGPGGMFGRLVQQVKKSSIVPLIGGGTQIQYLLHLADLAEFIGRYATGEIKPAPAILTAAHEQPWPFKELLQAIALAINKRVTFLPVPWRLVWAGLKSAETAGLRLGLRSDSLVSLQYQNPHPDFSGNIPAGLICRAFQVGKLDL